MSTPAGPLTLEDLERLEERAAEDVARWDAYRAQVKADPRSTTQEEAAMEACAASAARAQVPLLAALRSVMAERGALKDALSKSDYWLRTVRETREEEQAERRAARDDLARLRALCDRVREAWARVHETPMPTDEARRVMRAAIEALGPAPRVACPSCGVFDVHMIGCDRRIEALGAGGKTK